MDSVELAIRMTADASDATAALDQVGDAAGRMATDVDQAMSKADSASSRLDSVADSSDQVASRSSQAAGGIGDLAGALEATGLVSEGTAMAMETTSAAIMGATGAADLLNLVTTSTIVTQGKAKVAAIATAVAQRAQRASALAAAVGQRILNAAMRANPIGIVITLVLALIAGVVLLYKRSETFRRIVQAAFQVATLGARIALRIIITVATYVGGKLLAAFNAARDGISRAWQAIRDAAGRAWDWIVDKVTGVLDRIRDGVQTMTDKVRSAGTAVRDGLGSAFDWVMDKVQPIIDAINWIVDKLANIKIPDLPGFGRAVSAATPAAATAASTGGVTVVEQHTWNINGLLTESQAADVIVDALNKRARRLGRQVVLG